MDWILSPTELIERWPCDRPLAVLASGGGSGTESPESRWTIIASPIEVRTLQPGRVFSAGLEAQFNRATTNDRDAGSGIPPIQGGFWIGCLGYELGRELEPSARDTTEPADDRGWPTGMWQRCPWAYVHDRLTNRWWLVGSAPRGVELPPDEHGTPGERPPVPELMPRADARERFIRAVRLAQDHIARGDVYQVNLSHRLSGRFRGDARALAMRLMARADPWFGAFLSFDDPVRGVRRAIISLSPELFLRYDATSRVVTTRPMKGTRPGSAAPEELERSEKERAELTMIVDLMRNDLGRVCRPGSVRVERARAIERHARGTVLQAVATIRGEVEPAFGIGDLLRATFPPGSVTGAPKIAAMRLIERLEPVRRGPYCGAVGFVSDCGHAAFSVAIRTACLTGVSAATAPDRFDSADFDYAVGAGIVADSDPESEWEETLHKAAVVLERADARTVRA